MAFPEDLSPDDPNYEYGGKAKDFLQVLKERDLLGYLESANGGKLPPAECKFCKSSRDAQERLQGEALATMDGKDEPDGSTEDILQPGSSITCCLRKFLSHQADFKAEKPLLQITLEAVGHKCYFLPKFHCELNPIEMYWGWMKTHKFEISTVPTSHICCRSQSRC